MKKKILSFSSSKIVAFIHMLDEVRSNPAPAPNPSAPNGRRRFSENVSHESGREYF